ncbi:myophilin-like [Clytia hemisphaerica]|uniref:Transgelin n=1 Tax=Clytia hemisphaerica TaxID=252671 RepID=A0A7M5XKW5_9CNID|eukprot:TCONS_00061321-protein
MANRPKGYGFTAEQANKKAKKFDADQANEALDWIKQVVGDFSCEPVPKEKGESKFVEPLKDGIVLCKLMNKIKPGSISKINESKMAFKQMENISKFLAECEALGMSKIDLFQTVDLYEAQNVPQVVNGIYAVARKARVNGFTGPSLGPDEATENKREFSEEQLRSGEGVIGLQAGSNKGASQAGQNFGKTRAIID